MANKRRRHNGGPPGPGPDRAAPPAVNLDRSKDAEGEEQKKPEQQIELFTFEGKTYYMAQPGANLMLKILKQARDDGMLAATGTLLSELIGDEAYNVLMSIDDLEPEELKALIDRVTHFSLGRMESFLGN